MKRYLHLSIVALAAVLAFGPAAQADTFIVRECRDADGRLIVDRRVARQDPWLVRAGRSVVRSPLIIGETLTGHRRVVSDEGMFVRNGRLYTRTGYTIVPAPAPIAESLDDDDYMFRKDGRTLLGRGPGDDLELFDDD